MTARNPYNSMTDEEAQILYLRMIHEQDQEDAEPCANCGVNSRQPVWDTAGKMSFYDWCEVCEAEWDTQGNRSFAEFEAEYERLDGKCPVCEMVKGGKVIAPPQTVKAAERWTAHLKRHEQVCKARV